MARALRINEWKVKDLRELIQERNIKTILSVLVQSVLSLQSCNFKALSGYCVGAMCLLLLELKKFSPC